MTLLKREWITIKINMNNYTPVVGLEIHVELKTETGMFCQCNVGQFKADPNTHVCPVCLGLPGALPVPNKKAIEWTIKIAKALNCMINTHSKFDRKHYSYPDLPKGYQISQYDEPIAVNGYLEIGENRKKFRIHRVHLEEDTGKLLHVGSETLVDFNRSGTPLVEIVTEPDFDNSEDVKNFLEELHTIIRYLDVSDADMEKGTMRLEPNISVKKPNQSGLPPYKVEVKNINSFNFVKRAIDFEVDRHIELLERGETPIQETRGYVEKTSSTVSQRSKEEAHDYRYFPDPDIPPLEFTQKYIEEIEVPELPHKKIRRFVEKLGIKYRDAFLITRGKKSADFFETTLVPTIAKKIQEQKQKVPTNIHQLVANLFINKLKLNADADVSDIDQLVISILPKKTDEKLLQETIAKVIDANKNAAGDFKAGKQNAIMFLVGQVMREMKGRADATIVKAKLIEKLK